MVEHNTNSDWIDKQLSAYDTTTNANLKKLNSCLSVVVVILLFIAPIIVTLAFNFKAGLLFGGLFSCSMFINTVVSNLSNALIGRELGGDYDLFWRLTFILGFVISFSLYFSL